ncbi:spermiogenesis-related protein stanley-cup [Xylocopa sonorina]|uniref:spermiogenesis-related protein stanley-cup n=1 Tax=Xylocopa sonorina TaxID=1818115 RepID=UPI00403AB7AA
MAMMAVLEAANDTALPRYNVTTTASGAASKTSQFETDLHGNVNILLGGAMLSGVIMVVFLMCYCCHKSIRKSRPQEYPQYWRTEPDVHSLEVFTTEAHAAYCERRSSTDGNQDETSYGALSCPVTPISGPGPPPTYDSLIFEQRSLAGTIEKKPDAIVPSMVSTLLGLSTTVRSAECNEATVQETADEGLPSYEAALKLDANGYV